MKTIAFRVTPELERRFAKLAKKTGKSKAFYMREALAEHIVDLEEYYLATDTLKKIRSGELAVRDFGEWEKEYDRRQKVED